MNKKDLKKDTSNSTKKCVLCNKSIKRFAKWNDEVKRRVHRKCWLNFRDFNDRFADVLFCPDKKNAKSIIIKPTNDSVDQQSSQDPESDSES